MSGAQTFVYRKMDGEKLSFSQIHFSPLQKFGMGERGGSEGHKATDRELTYTPASQAYGQHHKPQFIV